MTREGQYRGQLKKGRSRPFWATVGPSITAGKASGERDLAQLIWRYVTKSVW
jgi:hypothetical protein